MITRIEATRYRCFEKLDVELGDFRVLVGANGSGKTTLIKSILGMVRPDKGSIKVKDQLVNGDPGYRQFIGYMPQIGRYPDNMKVGQLFDMMKKIRGLESVDTELINRFEIEKIYEKPMRTLSGGTRQKVSAALAFLFDPPILILDEPTAGLDPLSSEILKEKITREKTKGKLILITSHVLSELDDLVSQVIYMQDGKLCFHKSIEELKIQTKQEKLAKAIASFMLNK